jgi:hypothetical protein
MKAALIVVFCVWSFVSFAADVESGNTMLSACKKHMSEESTTSAVSAYNQGICMGMARAIFYVGNGLPLEYRICAPAEATALQALRVSVAYMEAHPALLHKKVMDLMVDAMHEAWPCKK